MKKSRSTRPHFTHARSCSRALSRALNRVPAREKPPAFHPDVFVKGRPLRCSFMLFVIRGFDVLDSGVLGVISDLSASRIGLLQQTITWYKIRHAGGQAHYYSRTGT